MFPPSFLHCSGLLHVQQVPRRLRVCFMKCWWYHMPKNYNPNVIFHRTCLAIYQQCMYDWTFLFSTWRRKKKIDSWVFTTHEFCAWTFWSWPIISTPVFCKCWPHLHRTTEKHRNRATCSSQLTISQWFFSTFWGSYN